MRAFSGSKVDWRVLKATIIVAALAMWVALAPGAEAYPHNDGLAFGGASLHQNALFSINPDATAVTAAHFLWAGAEALGESCPEPGHDHGHHIGCCAGMASCVSGCGAVIVPEEGPNLPPGKAILHFATTPASMGVKTLPSDPPPRASI